MNLKEVNAELNSFFESGKTFDLQFRKQQLLKLRNVIRENEKRILKALAADLRKPDLEAYGTEVGSCLQEITHVLKHLDEWVRPERISLPMVHQVGRGEVHKVPLGKVLIFGPWNYPFQLLLSPLIGSLAAGNVTVLKPSELTPESSKTLRQIMEENFPRGLITVVEGGVETAEALLNLHWNHIFFTGSPGVGKKVMLKAAENLTPVTLELGGKSPAWMDSTADLKTSTRRLLWGKFLNAGQTCIAPDYLLIHESQFDEFKRLSVKIIKEFYGHNPQFSPDFGRIVNKRNMDRLKKFLDQARLVCGGDFDDSRLYFSPTIMEEVPLESDLMKEEIFGPILPVIPYRKEIEAFEIIWRNPQPLAFYLFSKDKRLQDKVIEQLPFGGGAINDCMVQAGIIELPFGGIGTSGMGSYHGKKSFDTFTHSKSILKKSFWPDIQLRYPPYKKKLKLVRKILS